MSNNIDGVQSTYKGGKRNKRIRARERLKSQLVLGAKPEKIHALTRALEGDTFVPLEEVDVKRINKEIQILNSKL
jgi:hypothetical protein